MTGCVEQCSLTDSNLNHTGIYLYSKGKIMIHLTFDYKTDEKCTTPGQYLKYHRTFQGLSTRELAEKVGIVPATLVLYENDRHPIKHSTAVALANALGIDRNRLLDKYTAFVDYPYSSLLKKVRQELVDSALVRYNPEIIRVAKETAYTALKERELQDNAIAAEKGLKPYTLLNVEFNDGADQQSNGYIGWYYATLAVDGKICTHLETGLNHDIASGSVSPTPTRENYYAAGALKESDVDYVFNNVGFSSVSGLYSLHLSDAARERAELELAKKLIDDYCREEFHSGADFSDLSAVGIGHTTVTDDEVPIQAYANLADFRIEKYLGDVLIESRQYESLAALIQGELNDLEFGDLTYASDEQIAMFHAQEEVSGKEATSLNPAVQPVVTILWSESDKLQEGEQLPLARADALFKALDEEKRSEREKPGYTGGWYDKTKFRIDCTFHGERGNSRCSGDR